MALLLMISTMMGCSKAPDAQFPTGFNNSKAITVIARDAASGTRAAFHELMNIIVKDGDAQTDNLVVSALQFDGTDKVVTAVEGDKYAIGYISLGSVSERIKTAIIDGVAATAENVQNGSYKVSRPFLIVTKEEENELVGDFISFILSKQGQEIITSKNYITADNNAPDYTGSGMSGTITIAGSTSVQPVMELIIEAYKAINPSVSFEMQAQGSSQGIKAAIEGTYDIGMSSRELKDTEKTELNEHIIALDGIAVILNKDNPNENLISQNITDIYTGKITKWNEME